MRAFTILFVCAMLGAVSLATIGAVSTISQARHNFIGLGLAGGAALARDGRDHLATVSPVTTPIAAAEVRRVSLAIGRDDRDR
jgi:hypothetical protein